MRLGTDSGDYDLLGRAAQKASKIPGLSIELGVREGGGSQYMIEQYLDVQKTHIAIDPYGSLPYEWQENTIAGWVYDNTMRNIAISNLYGITRGTSVNFIFFNMTDDQFFERFKDGVPVYIKAKEEIIDKYAIVFLDAVHSVGAILKELEFFHPRMSEGGIFVFDDIKDFYDHSKIEEWLFANGYQTLERGTKKASYERILLD